MTSTRDLRGVGQFDLNTLINQLPGVAVKQTIQDAVAVAQNPITGVVRSVEFWTAYSPKRKYTGAELNSIYRDPTPNPYLKLLKPTIIVESLLGKHTVAPYGSADPDEWKQNAQDLAVGVAVVGTFSVVGLLVIGAALGRVRK